MTRQGPGFALAATSCRRSASKAGDGGLARVLHDAGLTPRSRLPHEPNFDLAWQIGDTVFVAEIKSITDDNEEEQLRLGLGWPLLVSCD